MLASPLVAQFQRKSEVGERPKAQWEVWLDSAKETFDKKKTGFTDHAQVSEQSFDKLEVCCVVGCKAPEHMVYAHTQSAKQGAGLVC